MAERGGGGIFCKNYHYKVVGYERGYGEDIEKGRW